MRGPPTNIWSLIKCPKKKEGNHRLFVEQLSSLSLDHALRRRYRIHLRTVSRWRHLAMYIAPVTVCSLFFNIPMFINLQVKQI